MRLFCHSEVFLASIMNVNRFARSVFLYDTTIFMAIANNTIRYVDTTPKLAQLCGDLADSPWLALDTEFLREKTYYPKFCLLQVATRDTAACIDPLALETLDPLFDILYDGRITKVFHSGRQDLEILFHIRGELPTPVFDTQIAAPLLGLTEQAGYGALVSELLKTNLSKAHSRTDWCRRPLSREQLRYAADDVIYLGRIYEIMIERLTTLGRMQWLEADFAALTDPALYSNPPEDAWRKIRGANKLFGSQLPILQAMALWRERMAQQEDRPRNWLLKDEVLIDTARLKPESIEDLAEIREINERTVRRWGDEICALIREAKDRPPISLEEKDKPLRKSSEQEAILDLLNAVVRLRALQNALNPAVLASKKDLELLLFQNRESKLYQGWRYKMVGKELEAILKGHYSLSVEAGELRVAEKTAP